MGSYYETFAAPYVLTRIGPPIPEYQTDDQLEAAVEKRLGTLAGVVDLSTLEVLAEKGIVTLRGEVSEARLKLALVNFADNTIGVRGVRDELTVR